MNMVSSMELLVPMKIDQVDDSDDSLTVDGKSPCLILLNNDLTEGIVPGLSKHDVTPAPSMGWHRRRKSEHYERLTPYVEEISELLEIDSWHLMPDYFVSEDKCLDKEACRIQLAWLKLTNSLMELERGMNPLELKGSHLQ